MAKFINTSTDTKKIKDLSDARNFRVIDLRTINGDPKQVFDLSCARQGQSAGTDWMQANGLTNQFVKVMHDLGDLGEEQREKLLGEIFREGIVLDVDKEKVVYKTLGQGASNARKAETMFAAEGFEEKFVPWYCCGLQDLIMGGSKLEKYWVYMMQAFSSSSLWVNSFPSELKKYMPEPDLDKIGVFKDLDLSHGNKKLKIIEGTLAQVKKQLLEEKDSDGLILIIIHDTNLSEEERRELQKLINEYVIQAFSIRAPGVKGLAVPVLESTLRQVITSGKTAPDIYGVEHDLSNLDMVWFKSSFKWSSAIDTKEKFEMYKAGFRANGHSIRVCKQNHPNAWRRLPAQQMQAILPNKEESEYLRSLALNPMLSHFTLDGLTDMIGNVWQRKVAKLYPRFLDEYTLKNSLQTKHITMVKQAMEGCLPNVLRYTFCAPDMLAIACHIGGLPIRAIIKEGEVSVDLQYTEGAGKNKVRKQLTPYGYDTIITRNPTPGLGIAVLKNVQIPEKYRGLFLGNTCFISVLGQEMRMLSMDYDGDTVGVMSTYWKYAKYYASALARAKETLNYLCVYFESASDKKKYSRDAYNDSLIQEQASAVGLVIDAITRLIDIMMERAHVGKKFDQKQLDDFAILEAAATLIIDAAKNGTDEMVRQTVEYSKDLIKKLQKSQRPMHTFWKKEVKTEDLDKRDYDIARTCRDLMPFSINGTPRFIRRDNWMGEYVAGIQNSVKGKLPIEDWIKDGTIDGRWVYGTERGKDIFRSKNMFFSNWNKQLPSLFSYGSVVYEDGKTDWSKTVFGRIIDEYLTLREELKSDKLLKAVVEEKSIEWKARIRTEGLLNGLTYDETLTALIHACYMHGENVTETQAIIYSNAKDVLWMLFGQYIYNNVVRNLKLSPEELAAKLGDDAYEDELDFEGAIYFEDESDDDGWW